jgi:hypothetical protein
VREFLLHIATANEVDTPGERLLMVGMAVGGILLAIVALAAFTFAAAITAIIGMAAGPALLAVGFVGWILGESWAPTVMIVGAVWGAIGWGFKAYNS